MPTRSTRELSRQVVRERICALAIELFAERGYDETTVDDIARAAGVSERTFFRYFGTKDEVLFLHADAEIELLLGALSARPMDEAPWLSLQRALEVLLDSVDHDEVLQRARTFKRINERSPHVMTRQLAHASVVQQRVGDLLWERWCAHPDRGRADFDAAPADIQVILRSLVGAVLAMLNQLLSQIEDEPLEHQLRLVRTAFDAIRPGHPAFGGFPGGDSETLR